MKYKFFVIPARNPESSETALNDFCIRHRISFIEKQLITDGADSFWSICVTWVDADNAGTGGSNNRNKPTIDYKQILNEVDFSLYLELRNHRKDLAEQQNVPAYAIFTNEQLANMIQQRVSTKAGLMKIPGVGQARIEKYADSFLLKLQGLFGSTTTGVAD